VQLRKTIGWQGILYEGFDDCPADVMMAKLRKGSTYMTIIDDIIL
jgi:hypothetical protein